MSQSSTAQLDRRVRAVLLFAIAVAAAWVTLVVARHVRDATFRYDAWDMVAVGRTFDDFVAAEVDVGRDAAPTRFRPLVHLVVWAWAHHVSIMGRGLALALWAVVLGMHVLEAAYLVRLGLRVETAALAAFGVLASPGVLATTSAHQFNDLMIGAFFVFATLVACLRPRGAGVGVTLALAGLGICSHESALLVAPLLVISLAFRDGLGAWRAWVAREDVRGLVVLAVVYAAIRAAGGTASDELVGVAAIPGNLVQLAKYAWQAMSEGPRVWLVGAFVVAALTLPRAARPPLRVVPLAVAWAITAYALYSLNRRYQSVTYLNTAIVLPFALLVDAPVRWIFARVRWAAPRLAASLALLAAMMPRTVDLAAGATDRLSGAILGAIDAEASAAPGGPLDVWIVERERRVGTWGRSWIDEELAIRDGESSRAFEAVFPDRRVRLHRVDDVAAVPVVRRPGEIVLVADEVGAHRYRLWRVDGGASAPVLLYGDRDPPPPRPPGG